MRIRVLEVLATLKRAGAERVAVTLACRLDARRFETAVVSLYAPFAGGLEDELSEAGTPVFHLGKHRGLDLRMAPRLRRVIRSFAPQLIHTHSYILPYVLAAAVGCGVRAIVHTVHNLAEREVEAAARLLYRAAYACGVWPVTVSSAVARSFRACYGMEPAAVVRNGIEVDSFYRPEARLIWRKAENFSQDDLLFVSVARLEPQKNPLGLIAAFACAAAKAPHWRLLLVGDGSLRRQAESFASQCAAAGRIHFLGVRQDIAELLSGCDVFVLPSLWEGLPVALLEAMAAGLPVVAACTGGADELVASGETGLLVPPGDVAALTQALRALGESERLRIRMGMGARERAREFSAQKMVAGYGELFEHAVRTGRWRRSPC